MKIRDYVQVGWIGGRVASVYIVTAFRSGKRGDLVELVSECGQYTQIVKIKDCRRVSGKRRRSEGFLAVYRHEQ